MVKLFWVGDDDSTSTQVQGSSKDENTTNDIPVQQRVQSEDEVGQVALDILENYESVYILAPIAGVQLADIDISVNENTLTISGVRNKPKEFYEHDMQVKNSECFWGKFLRNVILPENMDFWDIRAVMENNLLVIHIPKIRFDSQNIKINRVES